MLPLPITYRKERPHKFFTDLNLTVASMEVLEVDVYENVFRVNAEVRNITIQSISIHLDAGLLKLHFYRTVI